MRKLVVSASLASLAIGIMPRAVAITPRAAAKGGNGARTSTKGGTKTASTGGTTTGTATTGGSSATTVPAPTGEPDKLAPASSSDLEASGAMMEPTIKERIDVDHPAVDNAPRAGQPEEANRIDFNDPKAKSSDAVAANLEAQGNTKAK